MQRQIRAFADAGIAALILHPRDGLLVPYGGSDWFDLVRDLVNDCLAAGIEPILYDEDPYPSGSASGWIPIEHPELAAHAIERFEAPANLKEGELFVFPAGKLLWVGAVSADGSAGEPIDLTDRVGMIRRTWEVTPWDSRWYYPATPLYPCERSMAVMPEAALRVPANLPAGSKLVAFVARNQTNSQWGGHADPLNPVATRMYIERTHERYAQSLGDLLGREVRAIFTDEAKPHSAHPWTPGIFESFEQRFGYDLRPRLNDLFDHGATGPRAMLTRTHYRQWLADRFIDTWLRPVSQWCSKHGLALIGHLSPEDDPIQQTGSIGNLLPIQKYLTLSGIDLIIPAIGDARHPILNIGVASATSTAQQLDRAGVMSETLGASGNDLQATTAAKILAWQTLSGVAMVVVHASFASVMGLRRLDAPPDCGPNSVRWQGLCDTSRGIEPFRQIVTDSTQIAPVAIVWPIRSFMAEGIHWWEAGDVGPRRDLAQLLLACLQAQVGVHFIDEEQLASAEVRGGKLVVGRASYETILLPSASVIAEETVRRLASLKRDGLKVMSAGQLPAFAQTRKEIAPIDASSLPQRIQGDDWTAWCRANLPRLLDVQADRPNELRVTAWRDQGDRTSWLMMNIGEAPQRVRVKGGGEATIELAGGQLVALQADGKSLRVVHSFESMKVTPNAPLKNPELPLTNWRTRFDDADWRDLDRPMAAYQLDAPPTGLRNSVIVMQLTGPTWPDGTPVARHLDYAVKFNVDAKPGEKIKLVLEPTAQRGSFSISLNGKSWKATMVDTSSEPVIIDLTPALKAGENELQFRVDKPMALDGIKWPPIVRRVN